MKWYKGYSPQERLDKLARVKKAIADGEIPDPYDMACEICGQDKGVREYHSDDYNPDQPFGYMRVLCWKCHRNLHVFESGRSNEKYEMALSYFEGVADGKVYAPTYTRYYTKEMEDAGERPSYKQN